jgi:hypothetical protein
MAWRASALALLAGLTIAACGGGNPSSAPDQPSYPATSYQPQDPGSAAGGSAAGGQAEDPAAAAAASQQAYDALNQASQEQSEAQLNTARSLTP